MNFIRSELSPPWRRIGLRCLPFRVRHNGSVAQSGKRRLAQNEEVVGSNPTRTTSPPPAPPALPPPSREVPSGVDPLSMAILFAQQFKGW